MANPRTFIATGYTIVASAYGQETVSKTIAKPDYDKASKIFYAMVGTLRSFNDTRSVTWLAWDDFGNELLIDRESLGQATIGQD